MKMFLVNPQSKKIPEHQRPLDCQIKAP